MLITSARYGQHYSLVLKPELCKGREHQLSTEQTLGLNASALSAPDSGRDPFHFCLDFPETMQFLTWNCNLKKKILFYPLKLLSVRASVIHRTRTIGEKSSNPSAGHFCAAWSPRVVGAVLAETRQCWNGGVDSGGLPQGIWDNTVDNTFLT